MAGYETKTFSKHDEYMTPKSAWENIKQYIPKDKVIWECFYGNGKSGEYLREMGYEVIHEDIDFFSNDKGDIIISNPPFTKKKEVFQRLIDLDKPFIMVCPQQLIFTQYFKKIMENKTLQIIIPRRRIQFIKIKDGEELKENKCNFDCFYYCHKINLPKDIVFMD
tara:strand:+ start:40 stop:534 length:495 start_codon:yes stop_codon:yes gene_type:complete